MHIGETAIHRDGTYHINRGDPPERKEEVALHHLEGGTPRPAEKLLREILEAGHGNTRRSYLYALALFSERALTEVDAAVLDEFDVARKVAERCPRDEWRDALDVVDELFRRAWEQNPHGPAESVGFAPVDTGYDALPAIIRGQITRHLKLILDGVTATRLASAETDRVLGERMAPDRKGRAWKFFEPDPARPRAFVPARTVVGTPVWTRSGLGVLSGLLGLYTSFAYWESLAMWCGLALVVGGGLLACRHEFTRRVLDKERQRAEREHDDQVPDEAPPSPGHWVRTDFVAAVHERVAAGFRAVRPHIAGQWKAQTRGVRRTLTIRLAALYGNAGVEPESLDWLIRWHGYRCAERWRAGALFGHRTELLPTRRTVLLLRSGIALAATGAVVMMTSGAVLPALLLVGSGYLGLVHGVELAAARRDDLRRTAADAALHDEELKAFAEWTSMLADRPSDEEMGRWLNLDKRYLITAATRHGRLAGNDLMDQFVTLEKAPRARQALVPGGPPRYSEYVVKVFLLTHNGVRVVESELNFLNGARRNEQRSSFRYEALASAGITEVGVRVANDRYALRNENRPDSLEIVRLRSRTLRLVLFNGPDITVITNKFDRLRDVTSEEEAHLRDRELDAAGIPTALRTLEAVASEGGRWMQREHERRRRLRRDRPAREGRVLDTVAADRSGRTTGSPR
ncbi:MULTISPECIES: hypothetical protein [unclassified Saccharopolyspora]|uniref:hypothetical protein n=1 Tax=unclassified Saccharopolyspora TaxID=2646250 RepID=UPI001CD4970A|nr:MULTISPECIES: hypothetical protein [unclassified Saccharopolyspora]MCA1224957.1 hypothetical protein [Saccharopolyspora sp. 6M]MCA1278552.1 hypothetical protein [Saccharopolyspora sp. 7B]